MNCYVIFITFHHCCFRSEEWWRPMTFTSSQNLSVSAVLIGKPPSSHHIVISSVTLDVWWVCYAGPDYYLAFFCPLETANTQFSSLSINGVRTHVIMEKLALLPARKMNISSGGSPHSTWWLIWIKIHTFTILSLPSVIVNIEHVNHFIKV